MPKFYPSKYIISVVLIYLFVSIYLFFFTTLPGAAFVFQAKDFLLFLPLSVCAFISLFIANKLVRFGNISFNKKSLFQALLIIFCYGLFIALPEELIFRGLIQNNLQAVLSPSSAIILSSLIFGAVHLLNGARSLHLKDWNWKLVVMSFVAGLFLGLAYFLTGSLTVPIILHILFGLVMKIFIK
ncbi:MAG: CPBP family intramembrane glutamic endopeptidase [Minisyncoccia bacterium]